MSDTFGWIKIHRSILEWEWWDDRNTRDLFFFILLSTNHKEKKWHGREIPIGSFVTSLQSLSIGSGLSIQQVRTSLAKLKSTGEITDETTNEYRIITVCNYDTYQDVQYIQQQTIQQTNNNQITSEQQANNNNQEYKKEKNIEEKEDTKVSSKKKFSFVAELIALGVENEIANDWMKIRNAKKAANSETALKQIKTAIKTIQSQFGLCSNDIIKICVTNGWYGCKASYFTNIKLEDYDLSLNESQQDLFCSCSQEETVSVYGVKYQ